MTRMIPLLSTSSQKDIISFYVLMIVMLSIRYRKLDVASNTKYFLKLVKMTEHAVPQKVDLYKLHTGSLFSFLLRIKILCDPLSGSALQFKCVPILFTFKVVGKSSFIMHDLTLL